jgi:hypothetical protein
MNKRVSDKQYLKRLRIYLLGIRCRVGIKNLIKIAIMFAVKWVCKTIVIGM